MRQVKRVCDGCQTEIERDTLYVRSGSHLLSDDTYDGKPSNSISIHAQLDQELCLPCAEKAGIDVEALKAARANQRRGLARP